MRIAPPRGLSHHYRQTARLQRARNNHRGLLSSLSGKGKSRSAHHYTEKSKPEGGFSCKARTTDRSLECAQGRKIPLSWSQWNGQSESAHGLGASRLIAMGHWMKEKKNPKPTSGTLGTIQAVVETMLAPLPSS